MGGHGIEGFAQDIPQQLYKYVLDKSLVKDVLLQTILYLYKYIYIYIYTFPCV